MNNSAPKNLHAVYFQNLDAARFLAAFAVFSLHFSNEIRGLFPDLTENFIFKTVYFFTGKGALGVNFFFVLSGFLITYLIFNEKKERGSFHLGYFLIRRTLRIWPLYFIIGLIGFVLFPFIFSDYHTFHEPLFYFLFMANFDEIWNGARDSINFLTSPWSVAVEEQFYLFWGICLTFLFQLKAFKFPILIGILYLISFSFSAYHWADEKIIYHHTLAVCQDILMGAFVGWSVFKGQAWVKRIQKISKIHTIIIYAIGLSICLVKNKLFTGQLIIFERFVLSFFFAFILLDQINGKHSFFKFGKIKVFNQLGKISYGIYMYHLVVMFVLLKLIPFATWPSWMAISIFGITSLLFTYLCSAISYRFIESKFLSLKPQALSK